MQFTWVPGGVRGEWKHVLIMRIKLNWSFGKREAPQMDAGEAEKGKEKQMQPNSTALIIAKTHWCWCRRCHSMWVNFKMTRRRHSTQLQNGTWQRVNIHCQLDPASFVKSATDIYNLIFQATKHWSGISRHSYANQCAACLAWVVETCENTKSDMAAESASRSSVAL